jgi:hypothetical protein
MIIFKKFQTLYKKGQSCVSCKPNFLVDQSIPSELISFIKNEGFCDYIHGFFRIVNPTEFNHVIHEWIDKSFEPQVIAQTAFADLVLFIKGEIYILRTQYGELVPIENDIKRFFNLFLCDEEMLEEFFEHNLFLKTRKYLSLPKSDECYAYVPVLALGGSGAPETMEIVKTKEYLYLLAQIVLEDGLITDLAQD